VLVRWLLWLARRFFVRYSWVCARPNCSISRTRMFRTGVDRRLPLYLMLHVRVHCGTWA
jgi:hypothetical protein